MIDYIDSELAQEIAEYFKVKWFAPNYSVYTKDENDKDIILCNTGSDIIDADNMCGFLRRKYPEQEFYISDEHMGFER